MIIRLDFISKLEKGQFYGYGSTKYWNQLKIYSIIEIMSNIIIIAEFNDISMMLNTNFPQYIPNTTYNVADNIHEIIVLHEMCIFTQH